VTQTIKVIDYIMGSGKTTYIFNLFNSTPDKRFIYVTPLLSEAAVRAVDESGMSCMETPSTTEGTKAQDLLRLLREGKSISTTHSLFISLTQEHIDLIRHWKYTVVIDETIDFIESYNKYSYDDVKDLFTRNDLKTVQERNGLVTMEWSVSPGNHYRDLKGLCDVGMLYSTKEPHTMLNIQVPPVMFEAADEVIVITYMFSTSVMNSFMQLHGYKVEYMVVPELIQSEKVIKKMIKDKLKIIEIKAVDKFFDSYRDTALSHSWWDKATKDGNAEIMFKKLSNWFMNNKEHRESFYFSTPKVIVKSESINSRSKPLLDKIKAKYLIENLTHIKEDKDKDIKEVMPNWLCNSTRATNKYKDRTLCISLMNTYPNLGVQHYLKDYGVPVDVDQYALSEVLQYIWRGCIRDHKEMSVYLGSKRMRRLVQEWIDGF
jgi:hypothetical protein